MGYGGLRGYREYSDTGGCRGIQVDTGGYRGIQGDTGNTGDIKDSRGYREIQGIQGDTGGYGGFWGYREYSRFRDTGDSKAWIQRETGIQKEEYRWIQGY